MTERTELVEGGDVDQTISHSDQAELSFKCLSTSDDSTPTNSTWYKLETDPSSGHVYQVRVYNRSDKLTISGPDKTLTIKLAGNDSEGWAVYGGRYLCRATNGYSSDERLITIKVVDIPPPDTGDRYVMFISLVYLHVFNKAIVGSRLRPQSCCHLPNCIEMQEILDCKLDQLVGNQKKLRTCS